MSSETYRYWPQLDRVVNRQGSIFDVTPATIKGIIISEQEVPGYFEVVSLDTTRLAVTRNDVPLFFFISALRENRTFASYLRCLWVVENAL